MENAYDGKGRTIRQKFADGGVITYDHQEELSRTLVTEQNGNKVAHVYDERYRNVGDIYVDGEEHTSIFNGKLSSLTGHFVVGISRIDVIALERIPGNGFQAAPICYLLQKNRSLEERAKEMGSNDKFFR